MKSGLLPSLVLVIIAMACDRSAQRPLAPADPSDGGAAADSGATEAADGGEATVDAGPRPDAAPIPDAAPFADAGPDAGLVDAGEPVPPDPTAAGPFAIASHSETLTVSATRNRVPVDCRFPTAGPEAAPYPVVLVAHGFQLPASQYTEYAVRLASFGYVACTADYPAGIVPNHAESARDLSGTLDGLIAASNDGAHALAGLIDPARAGVMGHSLGGKLAFLAASDDPRFGAVLGLDPVDSSMLCNATRCPDATNRLPLSVPMAVIGELTDAAADGQACAPAADNYQTFHDAAGSPSLEVTVIGANHMSFLDSPETCGLVCSFCNEATADHAQVISLARAFTVAFFERHLRGNAAYDAWLTGPEAQARWVAPGLATLRVK